MKKEFKLRKSPLLCAVYCIAIAMVLTLLYSLLVDVLANSFFFDFNGGLIILSIPVLALLISLLIRKKYIRVEDGRLILDNSVTERVFKLDKIIDIKRLEKGDEHDLVTMWSSGCYEFKNVFSIISKSKVVYVSISDCDLEDFIKFAEEINNKTGDS